MNKIGKTTAIIFSILYLIILAVFFYTENDTGARDIGKRCATYVVDSVEGAKTTFHYENWNESCRFYYMSIMPVVYIIAMGPFLFTVLMGCGMGGSCSTVALYGFGTLAVIANMLLYASVGYGLVRLFSKVFRKSKQEIV